MNKINMIGTGHGFVHELYNTCFIMRINQIHVKIVNVAH